MSWAFLLRMRRADEQITGGYFAVSWGRWRRAVGVSPGSVPACAAGGAGLGSRGAEVQSLAPALEAAATFPGSILYRFFNFEV